ncbi:BnaAnng33600D, partial [Brassica napus]
GERSGISCKRIKTTLVNGFIVYTRTRRTKLNKVNEEDESKPTDEVAINDPIAERSCVKNTVVERSVERTAEEERLVTGSLAETNISESSCVNNTVVERSVERIAVEERLVTARLADTSIAESSCVNNTVVESSVERTAFEELLHEAIPVEILPEGSLDFEVAKDRAIGKRYLASKANRHGSLKRTKKTYKSLLRLKKVNKVVSKDAEVLADSELDSEGLDEQNLSMSLAGISNVVVRKRPDTVRELFETGILDGVSVVYTGTAQSQGFGLRGIITDGGILCSCSSCDWANVVTTSQFEIHANKQYKRASQYICFENGKSLLDVLKICRNAPLHSLRAKVLDAVDSASKEKCFTCKRCKGVCPLSSLGHRGLLCLSCSEIENSQSSPIATWTPTSAPACITSLAKSRWKITRKRSESTLKSPLSISPLGNSTQEITRKALRQALVGKALSASTNISSHNKCRSEFNMLAQHSVTPKALKSVPLSVSSKKRSCRTTRRDQGLHKLVFEREGLPDGTELGYYARGQKLLGGHKMGAGIYCYCCKCEVSPSVFEAHAGWTSRRKPYFYIYTSNGVSLHEWAMTFSQGRKYSANENDDLCVICADGGNLLRCDSCPRAFHIGNVLKTVLQHAFHFLSLPLE